MSYTAKEKSQILAAIEMSNQPHESRMDMDPVKAACNYAEKCGKKVAQGLAEYFANGRVDFEGK